MFDKVMLVGDKDNTTGTLLCVPHPGSSVPRLRALTWVSAAVGQPYIKGASVTAVIEQLTLVSPPTLLSGPGDRVLWSMARLRVQRQRAE